MDVRKLVVVVLVLAGGWWLFSHRGKTSDAPASSGLPAGATSSAGAACVSAADAANRQLHDAALLVARPPVDANAWSSAESAVSSAISSADSACGDPKTDADRKASEEVRAALDLMRSSLSSLSAGARGQGGGASTAVQNQEQIDAHLDRARGAR